MSPSTHVLLADIVTFVHGIICVFLMSGVIVSFVMKRQLPACLARSAYFARGNSDNSFSHNE